MKAGGKRQAFGKSKVKRQKAKEKADSAALINHPTMKAALLLPLHFCLLPFYF
jgi:hypothetical protein